MLKIKIPPVSGRTWYFFRGKLSGAGTPPPHPAVSPALTAIPTRQGQMTRIPGKGGSPYYITFLEENGRNISHQRVLFI